MIGPVALDQLQQDARLLLLGNRPPIAVVLLGLTRVGLVEQHHIEVRLQVAHRLGKGGSGGQRAIDQNHRALRRRAAVIVGVDAQAAQGFHNVVFCFHIPCLQCWRGSTRRTSDTGQCRQRALEQTRKVAGAHSGSAGIIDIVVVVATGW